VFLTVARLLPATGVAAIFALWLDARLSGLPAAVSVTLGGLAVALVFGIIAIAFGGLPMPRRLTPASRFLKKRATSRVGADRDA
jgi:hypothetical protein